MSQILNRLSKAIDVFADALVGEDRAMEQVQLYTYSDFKEFIRKGRRDFPTASKCTIALEKNNQYNEQIFSEDKYIIRMILLDGDGQPFNVEGDIDVYAGKGIIASSIDRELENFMEGKSKKTVKWGGR